MGRNPPDPDQDVVFAVLAAEDRAAVERLTESVAVEWPEVPGLRRFLEIVAALRLTAQMREDRPEAAKLRDACFTLGFADPGRAADSIARTLRRWREDGQNIRDGDAVA